jgi:hypothetical protein
MDNPTEIAEADIVQPQTSHPHDDDREIQSTDDDTLGRAPLARSIALRIITWKSDEALTIGITGPWGCGKSSIKNLIKESIESNSASSRFTWIDFTPWYWSGQDQLARRLVNELSIALNKDFTGEKSKEASDKLKTLLSALDLFPTEEVPWKGKRWGAFTTLLLTASGFACGKFLSWSSPWLKVFSAFALLVLSIQFFAGYFQKIFETRFTRLTSRSIADLHSEVSQSLRAQEQRLVVVFDDIDRLTPSEVEHTVRMIKFLSDLPNLVVIALYDPDVTAKLLGSYQGTDDYLQKIIRHKIDVPQFGTARARAALLEITRGFALSSLVPDSRDQNERMARACEIIVPWIEDLRDLKRFGTCLRFNLPLLFHNNTLEIDYADYLIVEALRHFEPEVYRQLEARAWTYCLPPFVMANEATSWLTQQTKRAHDLAENARRGDAAKSALCFLLVVPPRNVDVLRKQLRFPIVENVMRYLQFQVDPSDVSESSVRDLIKSIASPSDVSRWVAEQYKKGNIALALFRLSGRLHMLREDQIVHFVVGIWNSCYLDREIATATTGIATVFSSVGYAYGIVERLAADALKSIESEDRRMRKLIDAIQATDALAAPLPILGNEEWLSLSSGKLTPARDAWVLCVRKRVSEAGWRFIGERETLSWILDALCLFGQAADMQSFVDAIRDDYQFASQFLAQLSVDHYDAHALSLEFSKGFPLQQTKEALVDLARTRDDDSFRRRVGIFAKRATVKPS